MTVLPCDKTMVGRVTHSRMVGILLALGYNVCG